MMPIMEAMNRFLPALFNSGRSLMPTARPIPRIGPISGDMSMAPMMTAVELMFSPSEAMNIAKMRIHRLAPLKEMVAVMRFYDCCFTILVVRHVEIGFDIFPKRELFVCHNLFKVRTVCKYNK